MLRRRKANRYMPTHMLPRASRHSPKRQHPALVEARKRVQDIEQQRLERHHQNYNQMVRERATYRKTTNYDEESERVDNLCAALAQEESIQRYARCIRRAAMSCFDARREHYLGASRLRVG